MSRHGSGDEPARFIELYGTTVELSAAVILRQAAGWTLLSAGAVTDDQFWGEFERLPSDGADERS